MVVVADREMDRLGRVPGDRSRMLGSWSFGSDVFGSSRNKTDVVVVVVVSVTIVSKRMSWRYLVSRKRQFQKCSNTLKKSAMRSDIPYYAMASTIMVRIYLVS